MPYQVYLAQVMHHNQEALESAIKDGAIQRYTKNGLVWCADVQDFAVKKKGWREGTKGSGLKRHVEEEDIETMAKMLKGTANDFPALSDKETKKMQEKGVIPDRVMEKLTQAKEVTMALRGN